MSNIDDTLIITIAIQTHGTVITYELDSSTTHIFEDVMLLCKAGGFVDNYSSPAEEFALVGSLSKYFRKDIETTYDIISQAKKGILIGNITFDKALSIYDGEPSILHRIDPMTYIQGIYLLSIHKGTKMIYPENPNDKTINFMNVDDLARLSTIFNTKVPNIEDLSTPFPSQQIYIDEEDMVKNNQDIPENEKEIKIDQIRRQFYNNISKWKLTLDTNNNNIITMKLSVLVELIKIIIGQKCFINLLDYSCNSASIYIPKEQNLSSKYMIPDDIEQGNKKWGGSNKCSGTKYTKGKKSKKIKKGKKGKKSKKSKTRRRRRV
jgi:hypothetical protein